MASLEKKTYFLYGEGRAPDILCLGNLVLGSYSDPTVADHYTHQQLSTRELKEHASSTDFKDRVIHAKRDPGYGIQLSASQLIDFDVSWKALEETMLTVEAGTRVELKEPTEFLNTQVLLPEGGGAKAKLKLWLSAANSDYMLRMKWLRKPTVWMCTGLYLLEGTRVFTASQTQFKTTVGLKPPNIAALNGVQIGGSVQVGPETFEMGSLSEERLVWAAQYRRLDVKYIKLKDGEEATLPNVLSLYSDIISDGTLRGGPEEVNAVQLEVNPETDDQSHESGRGLILEKAYYDRLAKAVMDFEEELEE